jgi:hypothetical protein
MKAESSRKDVLKERNGNCIVGSKMYSGGNKMKAKKKEPPFMVKVRPVVSLNP